MNATMETDRVRRHTSAPRLEEQEQRLEESIRLYYGQPDAVITDRLRELDREWSMERWIETNASTLALTGIVLGLTVDRKWFALPLVVTAFLLQHAIQGWCPPVPVLRRFGIRTRGEIDREKYALKLLRGDFTGVGSESMDVNKIIAAFR